MDKIDFVILWVDGADPQWRAERDKYYLGELNQNKNSAYRDWDTLRYWFRGVEKYAPWVNTIHFVTYGHLPNWLDTTNPKLHIVNHSDFIPKECIPTFSANSIELNINRIEGLSEHFVYFNDDTYIVSPIFPEDFFINGLPCDSAILSTTIPSVKNEIFTYILFNDLLLINANFDKSITKRTWRKWINLKYGKRVLKNLYFWPLKKFPGFENLHLPNAYLKSVWDEVWEAEGEMLTHTIQRKFRTKEDVNQYIFKYWQLVTGRFMPRKFDIGKCFVIGNDDDAIVQALEQRKYKMICLNDNPEEIFCFEDEKNLIKKHFNNFLGQKSSYEI